MRPINAVSPTEEKRERAREGEARRGDLFLAGEFLRVSQSVGRSTSDVLYSALPSLLFASFSLLA